MSSNNKVEASMRAAHEHAQAHLVASAEGSKNTEIVKGTYRIPDNPHGSGMVRDPDSGWILLIGILVHNLTLQDGGYILFGDDNAPDQMTAEQSLRNMIQGVFDYMLNRPLIELDALPPERLCELLHVETDESNIKSCSFILLGFRQAFSQYLVTRHQS